MRRMLMHEPGTRVLIFSMYEEVIYAERALQGGASGYVTKASAPTVLVDAVQALAQGRKYISPDIAHAIAQRHVTAEVARGLSARELEILRMLLQGIPIRDIAAAIGLTAKTVANHQSVIKQKLGAETAIQLARIGGELLRDSRRSRDEPL
jgi:two-component system invasion response regulator UvrY